MFYQLSQAHVSMYVYIYVCVCAFATFLPSFDSVLFAQDERFSMASSRIRLAVLSSVGDASRTR
jgi:hypothetical protein